MFGLFRRKMRYRCACCGEMYEGSPSFAYKKPSTISMCLKQTGRRGSRSTAIFVIYALIRQTQATKIFVGQLRDQRVLFHSGGLAGQVTQHIILPELGCGIAGYPNEEDGYASAGMRNALIDMLVQAPAFDWLAATAERRSRSCLSGEGDRWR